MINEETRAFIAAHASDDVRRLALNAKVAEGVDLRAALVQIEGAQRLKYKAPRFAATAGVEFPERISLEQCSSEATAAYKADIIRRAVAARGCMADLTGGLGVDFMAMSPCFEKAVYVERNEELCALARNNFPAMGLGGFSVVCAEAEEFLSSMKPVDFMFLDPARRSNCNRKVVLLGDCTPDVTRLLPSIRERCSFLMLKLSPMLDISAAGAALGKCTEIHVVAVGGEVKEIIAFIDFSCESDTLIVCSDICGAQTFVFSFRMREERAAVCDFTDEIGNFLYEPAAPVLKAGAFRLPAQRYGLKKLHPNTHLYTSDEINRDFIGKIFKVESVVGFSKKEIKQLCSSLPQANVAVRNFPMQAEELRSRLRIKDGGDGYVFGVTLYSGRHVLVSCRLVPRGNVEAF